ncbi:hypothetical protein ACFYST_32555 [Kitasatospora sp. NPDC004614]|uniref:hypothetical protein n=1 Tax=unclassified Kitasatospora TaxID=2633591 RepID=UPI00369A6FD1
MTDPHQHLLDALDRVDAVFAPYAEQPVDGCTYCYGEADLALLSGPVAGIPDRLVDAVAAEVPDHWDDFPGLYRRLTPRILRSLALNGGGAGPAMVASRLLAAGWREWPERVAVERFLSAWWETVLRQPSGVRPIDALELAVPLTGTLVPWLERWAQVGTGYAEEQLSAAVDRWLERRLEVRFGFHEEFDARPVLPEWLLTLDPDFLGAYRLQEIERIAYS